MASKEQILKTFGFDIECKDIKSDEPKNIVLVIKTGQHYTFKSEAIRKISALVSNMSNNENDNRFELPSVVDYKFMMFLLDYSEYIDRSGVPLYNVEKIKAATTLENAINSEIYSLFVKHFNYKFLRSDLAVKQYLNIFGHFLECSTAIVSDKLITLFAIAHKIIIQHLPEGNFDFSED